jgi:hypothetical protein
MRVRFAFKEFLERRVRLQSFGLLHSCQEVDQPCRRSSCSRRNDLAGCQCFANDVARPLKPGTEPGGVI